MKRTHYKVWTKADDHKLACHLDDLYNGKATEVVQKSTGKKRTKKRVAEWRPYDGPDKAKYFQQEEKISAHDACRNILKSLFKQNNAIAKAMA